uniref:Sodium/potassium-transporting ATPase subunit beta n=1 Tax=Scophthalmus maximus TaxID=52904 RepID=A0A8D3CNI1_SCOMX
MKQMKEKESCQDLIYNPRTGEFLGRTASSWGKTRNETAVQHGAHCVSHPSLLPVFYGFLAGMFSLTMWVMLQTLDENVPRYQDRVANPGLVIRPHAAEISFNRSDQTNYNQYVQQLHKLLQDYNDSLQERNDLCLVDEYTEQDDKPLKKVCQFKRSTLRQCSGLTDNSFGFAEGKPCIIIKMNRVRTTTECLCLFMMSSFFFVTVNENQEHIVSQFSGDNPLQMQYFPSEGRLDKMFFPYYGKKAHSDYVQPLVAVKLLLTKDDYDVEQMVECRVEGSHLRNDDDRDKFQGRVSFRVKVSK